MNKTTVTVKAVTQTDGKYCCRCDYGWDTYCQLFRERLKFDTGHIEPNKISIVLRCSACVEAEEAGKQGKLW